MVTHSILWLHHMMVLSSMYRCLLLSNEELDGECVMFMADSVCVWSGERAYNCDPVATLELSIGEDRIGDTMPSVSDSPIAKSVLEECLCPFLALSISSLSDFSRFSMASSSNRCVSEKLLLLCSHTFLKASVLLV